MGDRESDDLSKSNDQFEPDDQSDQFEPDDQSDQLESDDQFDDQLESDDHFDDQLESDDQSDDQFDDQLESDDQSDDQLESDDQYRPDPLFEEIFRCLPFSKYKYPHLETGNKIIMPLSALARIHYARLEFPLIFEMSSFRSDKISHCGVLEFEAEEGFIHMPEWMMKNLDINEGEDVFLRSACLSRGTYMKLQPHTTSFIELSDPKAVLETVLRGFSCLSSGDTIMIRYCDQDFYIDVLKVGPGDAVSLIETDCEVDFAPPLDYKEPPQRQKIIKKVDKKGKDEEEKKDGKTFKPFVGSGRRIDGVVVVGGSDDAKKGKEEPKKDGSEDRKNEFKPFTGRSRVLREH